MSVILIAQPLAGQSGQQKNSTPFDYYRLHFENKLPHPLRDTLFEKTVWHKKVSHLVLEDVKGKARVTLLMILPYPYNYKSQNFAIYYEYDNYKAAYDKYIWLDSFLKRNGVLRVLISGSRITEEKILFDGYDHIPEERIMKEYYERVKLHTEPGVIDDQAR